MNRLQPRQFDKQELGGWEIQLRAGAIDEAADSEDEEQFFVEHNDDFNAHEDLRLMAKCRHHILANSTFSWWGAWLNPSPEKLVMAPRHWFLAQEARHANLLPPDWILLDPAGDRTSEYSLTS